MGPDQGSENSELFLFFRMNPSLNNVETNYEAEATVTFSKLGLISEL